MNSHVEAPVFCHDTSLQLGESLVATAGAKKCWLLIQEHKPWGIKVFDKWHLPAWTQTYLSDLFGEAKPNIVLIRTNRMRGKTKRLFVVHSDPSTPAIYAFDWQQPEDLKTLPLAQAFSRELAPNYHQTLYLVCTHGKRDKCCGKYGMPLYNSLKPSLGDQVWRSSHLGGDRFAANMVCLPEGLLHGRVDHEQAQQIVADHQQGRINLSSFRGRSSYSKPAQAAEHHLMQILGDNNLKRYGLVSEQSAAGQTNVCFIDLVQGKKYFLNVVQKQHEKTRFLMCRSVEAEPSLAYLVDSVTVVNLD